MMMMMMMMMMSLPLRFRSRSSLKVLLRLGNYFSFHHKVYCILNGSGTSCIDFEVRFQDTLPVAISLKMAKALAFNMTYFSILKPYTASIVTIRLVKFLFQRTDMKMYFNLE
jgi:hypothetical protein